VTATTVVNIYSIQSAHDYVAGWVYPTQNGNTYFEANPNEISLVQSFSNAVFAGLPSGLMDIVNSPTLESSANLQIIVKAEAAGGFTQHHCFSGNLPISAFG
jgi:hypothetical protein